MTTTSLVSVVIPVFNGMPYLPESVATVMAQDYSNFELILVDGGSTDTSVNWIRTLRDSRVHTYELPQGTPAATTWTVACEHSSGAFVKLMGQDDLLRPDTLRKQIGSLTHFPSAGMATGLRDIIAADGSTLFRRRGLKGLQSGLHDGARVLRTSCLLGTNVIGEPFSVLFRREALLAALPWSDERPLLLDLDLYTTVLQTWDLVVAKEVVGSFRVSATSWSTRMARSQRKQFRSWQREIEDQYEVGPLARMRASAGLTLQTTLRRGAYRWLALRNRLEASGR